MQTGKALTVAQDAVPASGASRKRHGEDALDAMLDFGQLLQSVLPGGTLPAVENQPNLSTTGIQSSSGKSSKIPIATAQASAMQAAAGIIAPDKLSAKSPALAAPRHAGSEKAGTELTPDMDALTAGDSNRKPQLTPKSALIHQAKAGMAGNGASERQTAVDEESDVFQTAFARATKRTGSTVSRTPADQVASAKAPTLGQTGHSSTVSLSGIPTALQSQLAAVHSMGQSQAASNTTPPKPTDSVIHLNQPQAPKELGNIVLQQVQTAPGEVHVKVHPEGMGDIVVSVQKQGDVLHVRLEANQMQTMQWLAQQSDALTQAIKNTGANVQSVQVAFGQASLSQGSGGDQPSKRQKDGQSAWTAGVSQARREAGPRFVVPELVSNDVHVNLKV